MTVLRQLLGGIIDFAGTYPPASLSAAEAVAEYRRALASPHAWMLGRLVWPAQRLDELQAELGVHGGAPWRVSAVIGNEIAGDLAQMVPFDNASLGRPFVVDMAEVRVASADDLACIAELAPRNLALYVEASLASDAGALLTDIKRAGWRAKMRTGGVTPEAFPRPADVLQFVAQCVELDVELKATAGLHHPMRGEYALTYEPGCPSGTMFGFLNLLMAVALLEDGDIDTAALALEERDPRAFVLSSEGAAYGDRDLTGEVARARRRLHSFGSCSFREPAQDLMALGVLA